MQNNRRAFLALIGLMALAPAACAAELDTALWQQYRSAFMAPDGRVLDTGNNNVSHSEGQGFAMLLALAANDREGFEALYGWTERTLRTQDSGLYAWRFDPAGTPNVADPNNATDGDVLIAWALLMASEKWQNADYGRRSQTLRAAILREAVTVQAGKRILLPGRVGFTDAETGTVVFNLSYYVWPALDQFARLEPMWNDIISDGLALTAASRFGSWQLPSDWIQIGAEGLVSPAAGRPPRFGYDAIRVPLYLAWSKRSADLENYRRYWLETEQSDGWPAWVDVVTGEFAPYRASPGANSIAHLILGRDIARSQQDHDYYSNSLLMLSTLAASA